MEKEIQMVFDLIFKHQVIDILGFLVYEMIRNLTETAFQIRKEWSENEVGDQPEVIMDTPALFQRVGSEGAQIPLSPSHVQEAFRRLQQANDRFSFMRGSKQKTLHLI